MHCASIPRGKKGSNERDVMYVCSSYNASGKHKCNRNAIHESVLLDFIIEQIQERLLSGDNMKRLQAAVNKESRKQATSQPVDLADVRARLGRLDADIKAAARELKRTPDDLYDLAVDDLRELRTKRETVAAELEALESNANAKSAKGGSPMAKALQSLQRLSERLRAADPTIAKDAIWRCCERIDLWFEHVQHEKIVRSCFRKGVAKFRVAEANSLAGRS